MKKYDIVVVGGGFAGVTAVISAAREGKSVLLLEQSGSLGGAASNNLVMPFMPYSTYVKDSDGKTDELYLVRGIFAEIVEHIKQSGGDKFYFDTEKLKVILDRMIKASGADVLFHAVCTAVHKTDRKITAVDFYTVGGMMTVEADCFIDATGDGNLAMLCGNEFMLGRKQDNLCQPMTLCFRISGVDGNFVMDSRPIINKRYEELKAEGKIKNPRENVLIFHTLDKNTVHMNTTRVVKLNPTDPFDLTKAEFEAREQMHELMDFLKSEFDFFKNAEISAAAPSIGVRESRMIIGEHILTGDELVSTIKFPDAIAAGNYDIDIHNPEGSGTSHYYFPNGEYYTIPYRCLVAKDFDNLLMAGRCVSCDHEAQASIRIMPICSAMGEAAGVAAAVAIENGTPAKSADITEIRTRLSNNGAFIG